MSSWEHKSTQRSVSSPAKSVTFVDTVVRTISRSASPVACNVLIPFSSIFFLRRVMRRLFAEWIKECCFLDLRFISSMNLTSGLQVQPVLPVWASSFIAITIENKCGFWVRQDILYVYFTEGCKTRTLGLWYVLQQRTTVRIFYVWCWHVISC